MSGQDVGFFDVGEACPDLVIENGDLKADNGLETAALISLFSDRKVTFDELPSGEIDRRGWWADLISDPIGDLIGSKYWLLDLKGKILNSIIIDAENYISQAFEWMIEDGIASKVVVSAERNGLNEILGSAEIFRPDGDNIPFKFIWDAQGLKILEA